jgi:hypothetical protein
MTDEQAKEPEPKICTYKPGGKSLKALILKAVIIGQRRRKTLTLRAPNGNAFHEMGEQDILEQFARQLERDYPLKSFHMVQVGRGAYNFVQCAPTQLVGTL